MSTRHLSLLILLAAFWGASFLFIRVGVADFGVAPLMVLRVGFGALFLLVLALARNGAAGLARTLRRHAWPLLVCGLLNSAAPFCLFAFAELTLQAGITSVINATAPLWAAVVAYLWLGERLSMPRVFGLVVGFAGVLLLVGNQVLAPEGSTGGASAARHRAGRRGRARRDPAVRDRRQLHQAQAVRRRPADQRDRHHDRRHPVAAALRAGHLAGRAGLGAGLGRGDRARHPVHRRRLPDLLLPDRACRAVTHHHITVTFVIPIFGILWGALFLGETVAPIMLAGCAVVLLAPRSRPARSGASGLRVGTRHGRLNRDARRQCFESRHASPLQCCLSFSSLSGFFDTSIVCAQAFAQGRQGPAKRCAYGRTTGVRSVDDS